VLCEYGVPKIVTDDPMNVDTMHCIDRLDGIPLSAVATIPVRVGGWLRGRPARPARRVLLVELSEMDTTLLSAPCQNAAACVSA